MDRVSDERLKDWIEFVTNEPEELRTGWDEEMLSIFHELRARREADKLPDPLNEGDGTYRP